MELLVFSSERKILKENLLLAGEIFSSMYPSSKFSPNFFPDINVLLKSFLQEELKSNSQFAEKLSVTQSYNDLEKVLIQTFSIPELLSKRPGYIALIYRYCIHRFVSKKHYNNSEVEDIVQEIVQILISRKFKAIKKGYGGDFNNISQFSSYFMVVVRNIYIDILRKYKTEPLNSVDYIPEEVETGNRLRGEIPAALAVEMEMKKLSLVLKLFGRTAPRFELLLRLKLRIKVEKKNVYECYPDCDIEDIAILTEDYKNINDREMFNRICWSVNRNEKKPSKSDTLRKWVDIKVKEIIGHLNHQHGFTVYNPKVFEELATLFYSGNCRLDNEGSNGSIRNEVG